MCWCRYGFVIICSLSFELLPPHGSGRKLLSKSRSGYCHWQMLHVPYDSYTTSWTLHSTCFGRNVVCTRTIYLPPTVTSQFSTLTCGLVKSTASLADAMYTVTCRSHRGHTFHFCTKWVSWTCTSTCASEASASTCNNYALALCMPSLVTLHVQTNRNVAVPLKSCTCKQQFSNCMRMYYMPSFVYIAQNCIKHVL